MSAKCDTVQEESTSKEFPQPLFFIEECVFPVTRNAAYEGMLWQAKAMKLQIVNHDYEQAICFYAVN